MKTFILWALLVLATTYAYSQYSNEREQARLINLCVEEMPQPSDEATILLCQEIVETRGTWK